MAGDGSDDGELLSQPPASRRRWWIVLAAGVLLAAIVSVIVRHSSGKPDAAATESTPPSTSATVPVQNPTAPRTTPRPPVVTALPAVPGLAGTLYARTARAVLRFEFSRGRLVTTPVPPLASSGPVSFVATVRGALVRPDDIVPGYLVPSDDTAAQPLQGALSRATILPGPRPDRFWMSEPDTATMTLVDTEGHTVAQVALPRASNPATPDGSGYLLASTAHRLVDVRPGRTVQVAKVEAPADAVVATGADRVLVRQCARPVSPSEPCPGALVSVSSGRTQRVGTFPAPRLRGVITSGGGTAVVYRTGRTGSASTAQLVELPSGRPRGPAVVVDPSAPPGSSTTSPDGRWDFVVARHGTLVAIDTATGRARRVGTVSGALQVAFASPVGGTGRGR